MPADNLNETSLFPWTEMMLCGFSAFIFEFDTRGQLRAGLFISLISVWLLVGVFAYLNSYTRRRYFSIWTAAWLFYALFLTISYSLFLVDDRAVAESWWATMCKQWCISTASVFMVWGGLRFLGRRVRQLSLALFLVFLLCWSAVANYPWPGTIQSFSPTDRLVLQLPIFLLIGCSSLVSVWGFFQYRRKRNYMGAGLLCFGFSIWGLFVAAYPFLERGSDSMSTGFFAGSVLQMFIAVNMIILVLEQIRFLHEKRAANLLINKEAEKTVLEQRIVLTEKRYRLLFEQSSEPIVITTQASLNIVGLNPAAARVLGVGIDEACQHSLSDWLAPGAQAGPNRPTAGIEWFDSLCHERLQTIRRKDGTQFKVEIVGSPVDFAGATAFQFYLREVTERSRLEQQLRQAEKLSGLGQIISGVVHELNNPLAITCGFIDLALMDASLSDKSRQNLVKAAHESRRAARLLRNFLNLARAGGPEKEPVDLNGLINTVLELRRSDFVRARIEVIPDLSPDLPPVQASLDQLQQIVIILLNNALQALETVEGRRQLRVTTRPETHRIRVVIEDSGPGVPPDLRSKIFEPFFTTKPPGVGTGLGLSVAHTFAMDHHGRIACGSSPLGGARFTVDLPGQEPPTRPAVAHREALSPELVH